MEEVIFSLRDVKQGYEGQTVLSTPKLDIIEGKAYSILGPNGAGKSTLLRLLNLIESPLEGLLEVAGVPLPKVDIHNTRRAMSMVFQKPYLYNMSVLKNVMLGLKFHGYNKTEAQDMAVEALKKVGMTKFTDRNAKTLSGGESQRVALARAIAYHPKILLLDEPTASLDPDNAFLIENIIQQMKQKITIIMVTHNIFQAKRLADRIIFLYNGELVEEGDKELLFNNPQHPKTKAFLSGDSVY